MSDEMIYTMARESQLAVGKTPLEVRLYRALQQVRHTINIPDKETAAFVDAAIAAYREKKPDAEK